MPVQRHVLVIGRNPPDQQELAGVLERLGWIVHRASATGDVEADAGFDLILLHYQMSETTAGAGADAERAAHDSLSRVLTQFRSPDATMDSITARLDELFEDLGDTGQDRILLLESFMSKVAVDLDQIDTAVAVNDLEALRARAHSLKGRAGNIGASRVAEAAAVIEDAACEGHLEHAPHSAAILRQAVVDANERVRDILAGLTSAS